MKGKGRNAAFFANNPTSSSHTGWQKTARETGKVILQSKSLTAIPDAVFSLADALEEGEKFWEINPLTKLDCSHNQIRSVADGKFSLLKRDLNYVKIRDNKLTSLPIDLFECDQLRHLDVSSNALTDLSGAIGDLYELRELLLSENELTGIPVSLKGCSLLQILELQRNKIVTIPPSALSLPQLQQLNLSGNRLVELPVSLGDLTMLEMLDVSKNALKGLPDLTRMRALRFVNASENQLTTVPRCPVQGKLDRLYLGENNIHRLDMSNLQPSAATLSEMLLQGNSLESCPDEINCMVSLKVLDISNNNLTNLPPSLGYMTILSKVLVEGNPIRCIRRALLTGNALLFSILQQCNAPCQHTLAHTVHTYFRHILSTYHVCLYPSHPINPHHVSLTHPINPPTHPAVKLQ